MTEQPPSESRGRGGLVGLLLVGSNGLTAAMALISQGAEIDPLTTAIVLAAAVPAVLLVVVCVVLVIAWASGKIVHIREYQDVKTERDDLRVANRKLLSVNEVAVPAAVEKAGPP